MKLELILILMLMLIPSGIASSGNALVNTTTLNLTAINESDPVYWYNKGEVLLNSGRYNESINAYNKAIELNRSDAKAWYDKGKALVKQIKYDEAIKAYDEAIRLDPKFVNPWYNKGNALYPSSKLPEWILLDLKSFSMNETSNFESLGQFL